MGELGSIAVLSFSGGVCSLLGQIEGNETEAHELLGSDISLDGANKQLYYADSNLHRVDIFAASGKEHYVSSFGGSETAPGFIEPEGVAVGPEDNIYISDGEHEAIDKFTPEGKFISSFSTLLEGSPKQLALDSAGDVFAVLRNAGQNEVVEFTSEGKPIREGGGLRDFGGPGASGVAVDRVTGDVFVAFDKFIKEYSSAGILISRFGGPNIAEAGGIAVNEATEDVIVSDEKSHRLELFGAPASAPSAATGEVSELRQTTARLNGVVNPESISLPASYQFQYATAAEWEETGEFSHDVPVAPASVGTGEGDVPVSAVANGLLPNTAYRFRIVGFNANANGTNGEVEGEPVAFMTPGPPTVGDERAVVNGENEAQLQADVTPNGVDTHYYFEYGRSKEYESGRVPAPPVDIGTGRIALSVSVPVTGLTAEAEYHFRVVAESSEGTTAGADTTFETYGGPPAGLPDGRAYELVSRLYGSTDNEDGNAYSAGVFLGHANAEVHAQPFESSGNGDMMTYGGDPASEGNGVSNNEYLSVRTDAGWATRDISAPTPGASEECPNIVKYSAPYQLFSTGLGLGVEAMTPSPALAAATGAPPCYVNLFVRETAGASSSSSAYRPLLTSRPPHRAPTEFGFAPVSGSEPTINELVGGGSEDLGLVFFAANDALAEGAIDGGLTKNNLYEASAEGLRAVNLLPNHTSVPGASFGAPKPGDELYAPPNTTRAISAEGNRVYWTDIASKPSGLYLREDGERTVQVDKARGGPGASGGGLYWTASTDGARAFFTDTSALTHEAVVGSGANLYQFEPEEERLVDLTGGASQVFVEGVIGASDDGSIVYFVAKGVLTGSEANVQGQTAHDVVQAQEECNTLSGPERERACKEAQQENLYVYAAGSSPAIKYMGTLSSQDDDIQPGGQLPTMKLGDWKGSVAQETARVSGNGESLVLVSSEQLTSYANGGHPEVYLYSLESEAFTCVSCMPTKTEAAGEAALVPDLTNGHQPRWLSEDGDRVFFDSTEPLVADDRNNTWDVYEWEQDGDGSCDKDGGCVFLISSGTSRDGALFDDATPDGSDVFFTTRSRLTPEDQDEQSNVFDAREGGGFPYIASSERCGSEAECRPAPTGAPDLVSALTGVASNDGMPSSAPEAPSAPAARLSVVGVKHSGKVLRVRVRVSSKGRVVVSGTRLVRLSREFTRAGVYSMSVRLTAEGRLLSQRSKGVSVTLRVQFTPATGKAMTVKRSAVVRGT